MATASPPPNEIPYTIDLQVFLDSNFTGTSQDRKVEIFEVVVENIDYPLLFQRRAKLSPGIEPTFSHTIEKITGITI